METIQKMWMTFDIYPI